MALNNVPLAGQNLNTTRVPINQNFSVISTAWDIDHVAYNAVGQGKHNKITFPAQNAAPVPAGGDIALYSLLSGASNELHVLKTGGTAIPFTQALHNSTGYTYLPSGLIVKWGISGALSTGSGMTVNIHASPIVFNNIYAVFITPYNTNNSTTKDSALTVGDLQVASFKLYFTGSAPATMNVRYLAIGD